MTSRPASTEELRARLAAALPALRQRYPIGSIGIFGSWARGEQTAESDVDLLVRFDEPTGLLALIGLEDELTELLHVRVDLVTPGALKPQISEHVHQELLPA